LQDLRAALSSETTARRELSVRCDALQTALRQVQRNGNDTNPGMTAVPRPDPSSNDGSLAERTRFRERLVDVLGRRVGPPSLALLQIGLGATDGVNQGSMAVTQLLQIAGTRMSRAVRSGDIVIRIDADEFACVVLDLLSEPMQIAERQISICPSIGIAMCPEDGSTPDELLKIAGDAMCRARDQESRYAFCDLRAEIWASQFATLHG
jgi:diguanylate cyclase